MNFLDTTSKEDYVIIQINRGKVNALNHAVVKEIRSTIESYKNDASVRGVIITGQPHFFSAGLDVIELYSYDNDQISDFFKDFGNMYQDLAKFPKPLIVAITGHSPAGGAVIAITADYRVMADGEKYTVGLNEVAVNIQISEDILNGYRFWLGDGPASRYILEGKLFSAVEARRVGLIDEVCSLDEVVKAAETQMQKYLRADDQIFKSTKYKSRKNWIDNLDRDGKVAFTESLEMWWRPEIRAKMKGFVDRLTKK